MNDAKAHKYENLVRLIELDPYNTLVKSGFAENMILCDIGAGSGIFSFPAAQISSNDIYALEIDDGMIEFLVNKKQIQNVSNLKILKVDSSKLPLDDGICDMAIMVTVLHEIENKESMLREIKRIMKMNGRFVVIEFKKQKTPMGPPVDSRISEEDVEEISKNVGFTIVSRFELGANFYMLILEVKR
ncbi:MAG: class I SAM-dependent methyltransferase [Saccharofermentanales bacterium]